ncbi:MAG: hypothetical protein CMK09_11045 [Ponticaulis sp.]|nr:hypothetical protein [Ponticaulis sp.]|tara:strand:+ start:44127 stop:44753 length:627 start_codon:yes stop_codon:yes gene_type:complete
MAMTEKSDAEADLQHKPYEDAFAVVFGAFFLGLAVVFFEYAELITGGISGLSLVLSYATPVAFGLYFLVLNLPFYVLAIVRMGWRFTLKTVIAVAIVAVFPDLVPEWLVIQELHPGFAAFTAGALAATGLIILLRHGAGIGGFSILAQFLQAKGLVRAGWFLLIVDLLILAGAVFVLPVMNLIWSVLGAVVMNVVIGINHRPGRYFGN